MTTAKTISKKISVKSSAAKPLGKPLPGDKTLGREPAIRFYAIEDFGQTEEGEEAEMIIVHDSNLAVYKQNLVKSNFPYIDTFDHEVTAVVSAMRNLTAAVFDRLDITSHMDKDQRVAYTQRILRGAALKKYRAVLEECKQSEGGLAGDNWELGKLKGISTENFWDWVKKYGIGYDGHDYLGLDKFVNFEREIWFEWGEFMWRKHRRVYQYHLK